MSRALSLVITTPLDVVVEAQGVTSFRAADDSGDFGILPGHADLLAVLRSCVARWREADGAWHFCALHGGVMTVEDGRAIRIACREGLLGTDIDALEEQVEARREAELQAASSAKVAHARLHARAIRQIMRQLGTGPAAEAALEKVFE